MKQFESLLETTLNELKPSKVVDAMAYSLLGGGKRVRPNLLFKLYHDFGYEVDDNARYLAGAVESIHTYSLIHDDLPALDNDDLRRFKPTNHIVYGEDIAILAGDGLLTLAFDFIAKTNLDLRYIKVLTQNAGVSGMILGQELDILNAVDSLETLEHAYYLKTGCLFASALEMATLLANKEDKIEDVRKVARDLGIAFQIQDDLLEVTKDTSEIGKSNTSDLNRDSATITSYLALDAAQDHLNKLFEGIFQTLDLLNLKDDTLKTYISEMMDRSI